GIRDFHVTGVQTCALPISYTSLTIQLTNNKPVRKTKRSRKSSARKSLSQQRHQAIAAGFIILGLFGSAYFATDIFKPRPTLNVRSEERSVGKECRVRCAHR